MKRQQLLAEFLGTNNVHPVDHHRYEVDGAEYLVLTPGEARSFSRNEILETLWAFNHEFLETHTGVDAEAFRKLIPMCEDANPAIKAIVQATCGLSKFVSEVIAADGRGMFLAPYDHVEHSHKGYFIYRVN